jgi:hypothetical protein
MEPYCHIQALPRELSQTQQHPTRHHKDKKAQTETGTDNDNNTSLSPPSLGTAQTEQTDKHTEIQTTLTNMQDSFTKWIQSIKDANEAKARPDKTRIQEAEKTYIAVQETILKEFTTLTQNYNNVLEAFSNLGNDVRMSQIKQDRHHLGMQQTTGLMMQILVGIHQNLANGTSPELLLQEQVNHLMQSTFKADDGNGAPGNVITESSSTTQQESG